MLDPRRLVILHSVIASGSVHGAARNLGYAPATVSQHLKALQAETGLVLFRRSGRGITPTPAAHRLAQASQESLESLHRLEDVVVALRDGHEEHFAITCFPSAAKVWLPHVAARVRAAYPDVLLEISLNEPFAGRGQRTPDLDIRTASTEEPPPVRDGYTARVLVDESYRVVMRRDHPLAVQEIVSMADLAGEPWIDDDLYDSPSGVILDEAWRASGLQPRYVARLDDHHAALAFIEVGMGITMMPQLALDDLPPGVITRPLVNPTVERRILAYVRDGVAHHPIVERAWESLQRLAEAPPAGS